MVNSREMAAHRERGYMTNATLKFGDKELELPMMSPSAGPDVIDIQKLYGQGGVLLMTQGSPPPRLANPTSPILTAIRASCSTVATQLTNLLKNLTF